MGISYGNRVIFHVIQLTSALHIQRQKTLQARNRQILAIRLARCAVSDLEKWYCLSEKLYTKSLAPSKTVTIKTLWIRSRRFFFSETRSRLHPIPEQHSVFNHHLSQGVSTLDIPRIFNITESAHRIHNPFTSEKLATLGAALRLERGTRVLDLGSGSGEMLCTDRKSVV